MWCRRSPALAGMAAALVLALIGGLAGTTWKWRDAEHRKAELADANQVIGQERNAAITARNEADRRRKQAEPETAKARAVVGFLVDDILDQAAPVNNPRSRGVTIEDALDLAGPAIGERFARQPDVEVPVRVMVGRTYRKLGKLDKAEPHLRRAVELEPPQPGRAGLADALSGRRTGDALAGPWQAGRGRVVVPPVAGGAREAWWLPDDETLTAMNNLAYLLKSVGKLTEAEAFLRQVVKDRTRTPAPRIADTLGDRNLYDVLMNQGKLAEGEPLVRKLLDVHTRILGPENPDTIMTLNSLGNLLRRRNKLAEAEPLLRRVVEVRGRVNGADHPDTLVELNNLARLLSTAASLTRPRRSSAPVARASSCPRPRTSAHPDRDEYPGVDPPRSRPASSGRVVAAHGVRDRTTHRG